MRILTVALVFSLLAGTALAQQEKILVPVAPNRVLGAYGSSWETDLAITNMGDTPVTVFGYSPTTCPFDPCNTTPPPIPAQSTIFTGIVEQCPSGSGRLLAVDTSSAGKLAFTLRTRDTSRDDRSWGAVVPVVRSSGLFAERFSIVDVPLSTRFRATLRIYDADPSTPPAIGVRFFAEDPATPYPAARPDILLAEAEPSFAISSAASISRCPGYAEISLSLIPALVGAGRIRIELDPLDGRRDYWAFVSVTNNETQEVTVISPH